MKLSTKLLSFIFISFLFVNTTTCLKRITVTIFDDLPTSTDPDLLLRCQSKDDDLGYHVLHNSETYDWGFKPNIIFRSTLFFCHFYWDGKDRVFDVYKDSTMGFRGDCINPFGDPTCYWKVSPDGFYFSNDMENWVKKYDWS